MDTLQGGRDEMRGLGARIVSHPFCEDFHRLFSGFCVCLLVLFVGCGFCSAF